jgi:hypothetical protein
VPATVIDFCLDAVLDDHLERYAPEVAALAGS